MTLDEAIKHEEELANRESENAKWFDLGDDSSEMFRTKCEECKERAEEHRRLAEWLKELKRDREALTELDAAIDCYENCETCQGFREYSPSQFIKDVIRINKEVNADADSD